MTRGCKCRMYSAAHKDEEEGAGVEEGGSGGGVMPTERAGGR